MELEKDILNRLRLYVDDQLMNNLLRDAADEIERLRTFKAEYYDTMLEENLRLRKTLEKAQAELDLEKKAHMSTARAFYEADENLSRSSGAQTEPRSPASKGGAEA